MEILIGLFKTVVKLNSEKEHNRIQELADYVVNFKDLKRKIVEDKKDFLLKFHLENPLSTYI